MGLGAPGGRCTVSPSVRGTQTPVWLYSHLCSPGFRVRRWNMSRDFRACAFQPGASWPFELAGASGSS